MCIRRDIDGVARVSRAEVLMMLTRGIVVECCRIWISRELVTPKRKNAEYERKERNPPVRGVQLLELAEKPWFARRS